MTSVGPFDAVKKGPDVHGLLIQPVDDHVLLTQSNAGNVVEIPQPSLLAGNCAWRSSDGKTVLSWDGPLGINISPPVYRVQANPSPANLYDHHIAPGYQSLLRDAGGGFFYRYPVRWSTAIYRGGRVFAQAPSFVLGAWLRKVGEQSYLMAVVWGSDSVDNVYAASITKGQLGAWTLIGTVSPGVTVSQIDPGIGSPAPRIGCWWASEDGLHAACVWHFSSQRTALIVLNFSALHLQFSIDYSHVDAFDWRRVGSNTLTHAQTINSSTRLVSGTRSFTSSLVAEGTYKRFYGVGYKNNALHTAYKTLVSGNEESSLQITGYDHGEGGSDNSFEYVRIGSSSMSRVFNLVFTDGFTVSSASSSSGSVNRTTAASSAVTDEGSSSDQWSSEEVVPILWNVAQGRHLAYRLVRQSSLSSSESLTLNSSDGLWHGSSSGTSSEAITLQSSGVHNQTVYTNTKSLSSSEDPAREFESDFMIFNYLDGNNTYTETSPLEFSITESSLLNDLIYHATGGDVGAQAHYYGIAIPPIAWVTSTDELLSGFGAPVFVGQVLTPMSQTVFEPVRFV